MTRLVRLGLLTGLLLVVSSGVVFIHAFFVRWNFAAAMVHASALHGRLAAKEFDPALSPVEALLDELYFSPGGARRRHRVCPALQNLLSPSRSKPGPAHYLATAILAEHREVGTFNRYAVRLFAACQLEREFGHDVLVKAWLSTAYLGDGDFGISAASENLFGKAPTDLDEREALIIAALLWRPSLRKAPEALEARALEFRRALQEQKDSD